MVVGHDSRDDAAQEPNQRSARSCSATKSAISADRCPAHRGDADRSWGLTLWTFWQNAAQLQIYGAQANTLVDNAAVIQVFGARQPAHGAGFRKSCRAASPRRNSRTLPPDEQMLLIEGKALRCRQVRYYEDRGLSACAD